MFACTRSLIQHHLITIQACFAPPRLRYQDRLKIFLLFCLDPLPAESAVHAGKLLYNFQHHHLILSINSNDAVVMLLPTDHEALSSIPRLDMGFSSSRDLLCSMYGMCQCPLPLFCAIFTGSPCTLPNTGQEISSKCFCFPIHCSQKLAPVQSNSKDDWEEKEHSPMMKTTLLLKYQTFLTFFQL